jgi:hypothetical protein
MGCYIQCSLIHRSLISTCGPAALLSENAVNFFFDFLKVGLRVDLPDPSRQGIK